MLQTELSGGWHCTGNVPDAQARLRHFVQRLGMRVIAEQPGEIHVRQGSWLARVCGPRFSRSRWLPMRAVIKLRTLTAGVAVRANIAADSPRAGLNPRLATKYRTYFAAWLTDLQHQIR